MPDGVIASVRDGAEVIDHWSARNVPPVVLLYVVMVFAVFVAVSHFVFHSPEAVKALLIAAIGVLAATAPSVLSKVEYQATESGIEKRKTDEKKPREFEEAFRWD